MLITLALWGGQAHALGLGAIALQSGLGRPLQARIPVYGVAADDTGAVCLKSRVLALDGNVLSRPVAEMTGSGAGAVISIRTVENINEPAVNVTVEIGCTSAVKRDYQLLLDPVPATLPMASAVATDRAERNDRRVASRAGVAAPTVTTVPLASAADAPGVAAPPKAPASVMRRPAPAARPKPALEAKSVLTLTGGDAEIEQIRARVVLRSAMALSEPRVETDPARLAALRADQARVAALLRGEDPAAATQAQLGQAQARLAAVQQSAAKAARQHAQEKAALTAAQEEMAPGKLVAALGALLLACIAVIGWLVWRRAEDRRRQEQAFFAMADEHDTPSATPPRQAEAAQTAGMAAEAPVSAQPAAPAVAAAPAVDLDFAMPADDFAAPPSATPAVFEWPAENVANTVSTSPPQSLHLPESWLTIEHQFETIKQDMAQPADVPPTLAASGEAAQAHADEVAGMLLDAESWMAEHNPLRAAEALRPYLDRQDMQSPAPGLYLLSLYRTMDKPEQISSVLTRMRDKFPSEASQWGNADQPRRSMADFPLVHAAVDALSDTERLLPYLNSLLLAPESFDFSTYREIVRAIGLATEMKQESHAHSMSLDFQ